MQVSPADADALSNLGNLLQTQGRADEAEELYRRALAARPGHTVVRINYGNLLLGQERYAEALAKNVHLVLMLSSMLHSIGVGNMLPSWVRVVCVDINPAVVTKLSDRGSMQTVGVVTDVGMFLQHLARKLD